MIGCKSACDQFATPQYCCTEAYGSPTTCPPTQYSNAFKAACPTAYSYAYDDATSTFTCKGANYTITFCPTGTPACPFCRGSRFLYQCLWSVAFNVHLHLVYIDYIAGSPGTTPSRNSTRNPPPPPSPYGISQYGTGSGVRPAASVVCILLLFSSVLFTLYSKSISPFAFCMILL